MNPKADDFAPVAQPGSPDYYALLFAPREQRESLRALLALEAMLNELSSANLDPQVRHSKLAWWAEELTRFQAGQPNHPVLQMLNQHDRFHDRAIAPVRDLFFATAREATEELPDTPDRLLEHAGQGGAIVGAIAMLLATPEISDYSHHPALVDLARARYLVNRLGATHQCESVAREPGIHSELLGSLATTAYEKLAGSLAELEPDLIRLWGPLVVMAVMLRAPLTSLGTRAAVSNKPLRDLLLAWQSARTAARGKLRPWPSPVICP